MFMCAQLRSRIKLVLYLAKANISQLLQMSLRVLTSFCYSFTVLVCPRQSCCIETDSIKLVRYDQIVFSLYKLPIKQMQLHLYDFLSTNQNPNKI